MRMPTSDAKAILIIHGILLHPFLKGFSLLAQNPDGLLVRYPC